MDEYQRGGGQEKPPWCWVLGSARLSQCTCTTYSTIASSRAVPYSTVQDSTVQYTVRSPGLKHGPTNTCFVFTYLQYDILKKDTQKGKKRKAQYRVEEGSGRTGTSVKDFSFLLAITLPYVISRCQTPLHHFILLYFHD